MPRLGVGLSGCVLLAFFALSCAQHHAPTSTTEVLLRGAKPARQEGPAPPPDTLETHIGKVRALSPAAARPAARSTLESAETRFPWLADALRAAAAKPSAEHFADVAVAYRRAGIPDQAYDYFVKALRLDPRSARSYDGLARLWRDWGLPHLAVPDAARAVFYAPKSPAVHNTLGTIFQALGRGTDARREFAKALVLDPRAAYALSNACYSWALEGRHDEATAQCEQALAIDPSLTAAHNNLALVYADRGDLTAAATAFDKAGDPAAAQYNIGMVYMARHQYSKAARAFERAASLRPTLSIAWRRAQQATRLEALEPDPETR